MSLHDEHGRTSRFVGRRLIVIVTTLLGVTMLLGGCGSSTSSKASVSPPARIVTITIPAGTDVAPHWWGYPGPPRANVLLPAGYDPHRRYPLLVLLNGFDTDYDWYAHWGLAQLLDHLGAIVVMPEGASGWYANWWNDGQRGDPAWETYELDVVIPSVLARYPILPGRHYHAIAGTSMGGLGAVYLAGRLPGFFGSVASLSGWDDPQYEANVVQPGMAEGSEATANGDHDPDPIYGPPNGFYATGHNPVALAKNLRHTRVFESTGNGTPAKGEPPDPTADSEEALFIYPMNKLYHPVLVKAGVDVTYQVHAGGHDIPAFRGEIKAMLKWGLFKTVPADPSSWTDVTVATSGQLWDIDYRFTHPPVQMVTFAQTGTSLSVSTAGSPVTITEPSGCTVRVATPTKIRLTSRGSMSPSHFPPLPPTMPTHAPERKCSP
ncbi:MAG: alpha/beta hydrolase-fold protein [Actinomycetota bacterium]|jgi:S-formylglutathione hydrolase FrmB|nr:alpha/beta hydrolase-fold protein [Actinomycetota bacterium]